MDGFEATAAIRREEFTTGRHLSIVALTAHAIEGERQRCLGSQHGRLSLETHPPRRPQQSARISPPGLRHSGSSRPISAWVWCPTTYDPKLLAALPQEVLARDYRCGGSTRYFAPGETVVDLGSVPARPAFVAAKSWVPPGMSLATEPAANCCVPTSESSRDAAEGYSVY